MKFSEQIFFIENEYHSKDYLMSFLNNDVYNFFLENQYLKINGSGFLAFEYVGVLTVDDNIICILPKYFKDAKMNENERASCFKKVLQVLKKAGNSDRIPDSKYLRNSALNISEIAVADFLIKDYIENGIYQKQRDEVLINSNGEVSWDHTISRLDPIISKGRPIYHDQFHFTNINEEFNAITELHKYAVKYCLRKYSNILDYSVTYSEDTIDSIDFVGEMEHILNLLDRELRVTYRDREILLLENLHRLFSNKGRETKNNFNIYGTGYFYIVWEMICSFTFTNKREKYSHLIPKPRWHFSEIDYLEKETLTPDVVTTSKDESTLFVLDAKYYNLRMFRDPQASISGNPGVSDVTKQILYEKAFSSVPAEWRFNAFLFPEIIDSHFKVRGYTTFELLEGHKVYNIVLNPDIFFDAYLRNEEIGLNLLKIFYDQINSNSFDFE